MKNLLSGALVLFSLTLYGGESNFIRVETRMGFGGRIATGIEKIGSVNGSEVHEIDTTVMEDAWTTFSSDGATLSLCVLNVPAVEGGRLDADTTWNAERVHVVRDNVIVPDGVTLTLPCDCIVKFTEGARIYVESGGRIAAKGAILTDVADDTVGGDTNLDGGSSTPSGADWWNDDVVIGALYRETLPSGVERGYSQRPITFIIKDGTRYGYGGDMLWGYEGEMSDGYELVIPDGVTVVVEGAFEGCKELKSVAFPMGVTEIGYDAFVGCSGLVSVTLPPSVTEIRDEAFCDCAKLGSVTIPSSVTKIGINAFGGTALLAGCPNGPVVVDNCLIAYKGWCAGALEIPSGVRLIADGVFDEWEKWEEWGAWDGLTSVKIPSSVVDIGRTAFCGCRGLTSVEIPSSVRNIGQGAFGDCCNLASIEIPPSVTNIGRSAFSGCSTLTSVTIPSSVICIDSFAFADCTGLMSVTIPSSVTSIEAGVFAGCSSLISVTIPSGVRYIGFGAFEGCTGLTSVMIPLSVTTIVSYAFEDCTGLVSVTIPPSVTSIEEDAFDGCNCLACVHVGKGDLQRVKELYQWSDNVKFIEKIFPPIVNGDEGATVTGDAETGFVIRPSEGKTTVEVLIPQGVDVTKVTVEVSPKVTSVKPNGAKVKIVSGGADITGYLNVPVADGNGVVDLTKATVKEEYVKEAMDVEKGAVIDLCSGSQGTASPTITTAPTRMGLFYQLYEGETLDGMKDGDSKVGDGQPWSPEIKVKGGNSAFYSIDVRKNKISFVDIIRRLVDK